MRNASDWFIASWVSSRSSDTTQFLNMLLTLGVLNAVFAVGRAFTFAVAGLRAAKLTHNAVLQSVLQTTYGFFVRTSPGAMLNRLSKDVYAVDDALPFQLNIVLAQAFLLLGAVVVTVGNTTWVVALLLLPLFGMFLRMQAPYRAATREVKRAEAESRTPLIDSVVEIVDGGAVIRALRDTTMQAMLQRSDDALVAFQDLSYTLVVLSLWFGLRLQVIGTAMLFVVGVAALALSSSSSASASGIGLALAYVGPMSSYLSALLSSYTELEKLFVSVERVHEYVCLPSEADEVSLEGPIVAAAAALPPSWPLHGRVRFSDVSLQYERGARQVLRNVTLDVSGGSHVAIVGRTGAGKSSMIAALLRLRPLVSGAVEVDGIDVASVPHDQLRRQFGVLPQDPFCRHGTIRDNLDPKGLYTADEMKYALGLVGMRHVGIDAEVSENGSNFSAGERQLIALARLLMEQPRLLVLDEPTANIDPESSDLLDRAVSQHFRCVTTIVVTHKLGSIRQYDRVIVMREGAIAEDGAPGDLLADNASLLAQMCAAHED